MAGASWMMRACPLFREIGGAGWHGQASGAEAAVSPTKPLAARMPVRGVASPAARASDGREGGFKEDTLVAPITCPCHPP
jgi:hypothetical protein